MVKKDPKKFRMNWTKEDEKRLLESMAKNKERISGEVDFVKVAQDLSKYQKKFDKDNPNDIKKLQRRYSQLKEPWQEKVDNYILDNTPEVDRNMMIKICLYLKLKK